MCRRASAGDSILDLHYDQTTLLSSVTFVIFSYSSPKDLLIGASSSSLKISVRGANYLLDRIDLIEIDRELSCGNEKYSVAQRKHVNEL